MESAVKRLLAAAVTAAVFFSFAFVCADLVRRIPEEERRGGLVSVEYSGGFARVSVLGHVIKLDLAAAGEIAERAANIARAGLGVVPDFVLRTAELICRAGYG